MVNWDAVGAIAEILGAVAVFATLAYLTIQVKQNSKLLRATIREQRTGSSHRIIQWSAEFEERDQAHSLLCHAMFRDWDTYIRQHGDNLIDAAEWRSQMLIWETVLQDPRVALVWDRFGHGYSEALQKIVDPLAQATLENGSDHDPTD